MMKIKNNNIIILGLAALTLSGCKSLYGKYERPDIKTSGIMRDAMSDSDTLAVTDTTSFANIPWRSVFTDSHLQSLIETGLAHNTNLLSNEIIRPDCGYVVDGKAIKSLNKLTNKELREVHNLERLYQSGEFSNG